ncbi:MAG TPA: hypothetical protein VLL27_12095 [Solirubrobacterales bacterium]|nr:hypothetical protein [Solirubrobacterales bacterium]
MASLVLAIGAMMAFAGAASAHNHDFGSGDPTGTISSFDADSGVLTIDLTDGGQVSGLVTDETSIETGSGCRHGDHGDDERRGRKAGGLRHGDDGDHNHGWHHGWWHHGEGSTDDLVPGAVVDNAILVLADGKATFVKVELADSGSESTTSKAKASKARS